MQAKLEVLRGAKMITIAVRLPTIIGRSGDSTVKLPASTVSRHHCELYQFEGQLVVRDLDSSNGTVVNGYKIKGPTYLTLDDELTIGPVTMRTSLLGDSTPPPLVAPAAEAISPTEVMARPEVERTEPVPAVEPSVTDMPVEADDKGSFLAYSEDDGGGFVGIAPVDQGRDANAEAPVFDPEDANRPAVAADESALNSFLKKLDD